MTQSERGAIQYDLEQFLQERNFNAPYGVISTLEKLPKGGYVRVVTFGLAATLDCEVRIWSAKNITVKAYGPASRSLHETYQSIELLKQDLKYLIGETL